MIEWVRLWHDMPTDPKFRTIAKSSRQPLTSVVSVFLFMMVDASANANERGRTHANDEDIASAFDLDEEAVSAIRKAMQGRLLDGDRLTGWENRQPKREDNSSERAKAWREAKKTANADERTRTQTNANERPDTDKDTEKKEEGSLRSPCRISSGDLFEKTDLIVIEPERQNPSTQPSEHPRFVEFWQTYPKRLGTNSRKDASVRFARAVKSGADPGTLILGAARYAAHCDETGKTGTDKVQQTTTWLNQQNWETDYGKPQPQHQAATGRPAVAGNAHIANAVRSLEMREHRFTDPVSGAFDRDAADADDRDRIDRARAQLFPATFGHRSR